MTTALDLINAIECGKTLECEQAFADLVQSKVEAAIAARADEVRAGMFESAELDEGAKYVTFSGKDANKNPVNVHVGTDDQGNKYHVVSGNPSTNHHPSKVFLGSNDAAEKKMKSVADMVHAGKHDEALAHLNKTSHIKFSKAG